MYSLRTCKGWLEEQAGLGLNFGDCAQARLGLVILFFAIAIIRKWVAEPLELPFNFLLGEVGAVITYIIVVSLTGSFKLALIIGFLGGLAAGYFGSFLLGASESE